MILQRRAFITGLISSLAAPIIVRASSLMPVKAVKVDYIITFDNYVRRILNPMVDEYLKLSQYPELFNEQDKWNI